MATEERMLRVVIVDDEPLAREGIRLRLERSEGLEVVGEAGDGFAAVRLIEEATPDVVFLDVQMPGLNGFEVLEMVAGIHLPIVVFVTAHDVYALRAFEVHAVDYLLKPYSAERFGEAVRRARREVFREDQSEDRARVAALLLHRDTQAPAGGYVQRLTVRDGRRYLLIDVGKVDWMETAGNYVNIHASGSEYLVRGPLKELEARLNPSQFVRIHRTAIVNLERIAEIQPDPHGDFDVVLKNGATVRMSRNYRERLLGR